MNPAHKRFIQDYKRDYNNIKNKLEEMTNNKYPDYPEWENSIKKTKRHTENLRKKKQ